MPRLSALGYAQPVCFLIQKPRPSPVPSTALYPCPPCRPHAGMSRFPLLPSHAVRPLFSLFTAPHYIYKFFFKNDLNRQVLDGFCS